MKKDEFLGISYNLEQMSPLEELQFWAEFDLMLLQYYESQSRGLAYRFDRQKAMSAPTEFYSLMDAHALLEQESQLVRHPFGE